MENTELTSNEPVSQSSMRSFCDTLKKQNEFLKDQVTNIEQSISLINGQKFESDPHPGDVELNCYVSEISHYLFQRQQIITRLLSVADVLGNQLFGESGKNESQSLDIDWDGINSLHSFKEIFDVQNQDIFNILSYMSSITNGFFAIDEKEQLKKEETTEVSVNPLTQILRENENVSGRMEELNNKLKGSF